MSLLKAIVIALVVATLTGCVDDAAVRRPVHRAPRDRRRRRSCSTTARRTPTSAPCSTSRPVPTSTSSPSPCPGPVRRTASPARGTRASCWPSRTSRTCRSDAERVEPLKGPGLARRVARGGPQAAARRGRQPVARRPVLDAEACSPRCWNLADDTVTIVAVGPLTNLAVTLPEHPEQRLADRARTSSWAAPSTSRATSPTPRARSGTCTSTPRPPGSSSSRASPSCSSRSTPRTTCRSAATSCCASACSRRRPAGPSTSACRRRPGSTGRSCGTS